MLWRDVKTGAIERRAFAAFSPRNLAVPRDGWLVFLEAPFLLWFYGETKRTTHQFEVAP